jgi:hypothetical protein
MADSLFLGAPSNSWKQYVFAAGDFTGSASMTWTVEIGDVAIKYMIQGKLMIISFVIATTTVGGTPDVSLQFTIPEGKRAGAVGATWNACRAIDNAGTPEGGMVIVGAGGTQLLFRLLDGTNWAAATNTTTLNGEIAFEIQA